MRVQRGAEHIGAVPIVMRDVITHPQPIGPAVSRENRVVPRWHLRRILDFVQQVAILRIDREEKGLYNPLGKAVEEAENKECGGEAVSGDAPILPAAMMEVGVLRVTVLTAQLTTDLSFSFNCLAVECMV